MPEVRLDSTQVPSVTGQLVTCRVPEHVAVALERQSGSDSGALHELVEAIDSEGIATLGDKYEAAGPFLRKRP